MMAKTLRDLSLAIDLEIVGQDYEPAAQWARALKTRAERELRNGRLGKRDTEGPEKTPVGRDDRSIE
jgi:hypothetical protein